MTDSLGRAEGEIVLSADGAIRQLNRVKSGITGLDSADAGLRINKKGGFLSGAIGTMTGFLGANLITGMVGQIKGMASAFIWGASDMAEAQSKVNVVFGDSASTINDWANGATKNFGMTKTEALDAAGTFGNLFTSMGFTQGAAGDMSTSFLGLAADMGSFNNVPTADALAAIQSGLVGEYEPLRRFGVNLTEAGVQAYAMAHGIWDGTGAMTDQQKVLARQGLIMEQTTNAQGDFARTSTGLANQTRILKAQLQNMAATIGAALLPVVLKLTSAGVKAMDWVSDLGRRFQILRNSGLSPMQAILRMLGTDLTKVFGPKIAAQILKVVSVVLKVASAIGNGLAAAVAFLADHLDIVLPALIGVGVALAGLLAVAGVSAVIAGIGSVLALLLSPIVLIIAAAALLGVAWSKNWGDIQGKTAAAWSVIKPILQNIVAGIQLLKDAFDAGGWGAVWDLIKIGAQQAFDVIKSSISDIVDSIQNINWGGFLSGAWNAIKTGLQFAWDAITSIHWADFIPDINWRDFIGKVGDLAQWIAGKIGDIEIGDLVAKGASIAGDIAEWIKGKITAADWMDLFTKAGSIGATIATHITDLIASVDWKDLFTKAGSIGPTVASHIIGLIASVDWRELFTKAGSLATTVGNHIVGLITSVDWRELFTKAGGLALTVGQHIVSLIKDVDWRDLFTKAGGLALQVGGHIVSLIKDVDWRDLFTKAGGLALAVGGHIVDLIKSVNWTDIFTKAAELGTGLLKHITGLITSVDWTALFGKSIDVAQGLLDWLQDAITIPDLSFPSKEEILSAIVNAIKGAMGFGSGESQSTQSKSGDSMFDDIRAELQKQAAARLKYFQDTGQVHPGSLIPPEIDPKGGNTSSTIPIPDISGFAAAMATIKTIAQDDSAAAWNSIKLNMAGVTGTFGAESPKWPGPASAALAAIKGAFDTNLVAARVSATSNLGDVTSGIVSAAARWAGPPAGALAAIKSAVTSNLQASASTTASQMQAIKNSMTTQAQAGASSVRTHMSDSALTMKFQMAAMYLSASSQMKAVAQALTSGAVTGVQGVKGAMSTLPNIVRNAGSAAASVATGVGANIGNAMARGMESALGRIRAAANAMVAAASAALVAKAMIASPSKLFLRYGDFVGQGFVNGILAKVGDAADAARQLVSQPSLPSLAFAGSGSGYATTASSRSYVSNVDVGGVTIVQQPGEDGEALAGRVMQELDLGFSDMRGL